MADTISAYIAQFPGEMQGVLLSVWRTMLDALPGAEEMVSYQIPTFRRNRSYVIYSAGYKNHVGSYPVLLALPEMADALAHPIFLERPRRKSHWIGLSRSTLRQMSPGTSLKPMLNG
jgi:uncharacterized protein YdhG (YjbR/CyaY superfamily)